MERIQLFAVEGNSTAQRKRKGIEVIKLYSTKLVR